MANWGLVTWELVSANQFTNYQSLSFSYPNLINKSPVASLNTRLCSSVKYFFHSPVFPERKVGDLAGLMDDSSASRMRSRGAGVGARVMRCSMMVEPSEVGCKTFCNVGEFDFQFGPA